MLLFITISFVAGVLTVLASCILPLLPIIIGGSVSGGSSKRAYTVIGSLILSLVLFTLLIKVSSVFLNVSPDTWKYISATILFALGSSMVFPDVYEKFPFIQKLSVSSNKVLGKGLLKKTFFGDVIMGASLGPVFSTCSPTYFVILATVLPANFLLGLVYLFAYSVGLGLSLLTISLFGQKLANKLAITFDTHGKFKKIIGAIFILVSIAIGTGFDKKIEALVVRSGFFDVTKIEQKLLIANSKLSIDNDKKVQADQAPLVTTPDVTKKEITQPSQKSSLEMKNDADVARKYPVLGHYSEITNPAGFINTNGQPIKIADYIGKKIILLDFLTYSCINCQRTFPYLVDWNTKYSDKGLIIIGIHTPEFAFEKVKANVEAAMKKEGITFPIVLDNTYGTWNAYKNQFWPRKYIIDLKGNIVYDHIGEGNYTETEEAIQSLLKTIPGNQVVSSIDIGSENKAIAPATGISSETYLGYARIAYNVNTKVQSCEDIVCDFMVPTTLVKNTFAFGGSWKIEEDKVLGSVGSTVTYHTVAKKVHLVAGAEKDGETAMIEVSINGVKTKELVIGMSDLYTLFDGTSVIDQTISIKVIRGNIAGYTFTFS